MNFVIISGYNRPSEQQNNAISLNKSIYTYDIGEVFFDNLVSHFIDFSVLMVLQKFNLVQSSTLLDENTNFVVCFTCQLSKRRRTILIR